MKLLYSFINSIYFTYESARLQKFGQKWFLYHFFLILKCLGKKLTFVKKIAAFFNTSIYHMQINQTTKTNPKFFSSSLNLIQYLLLKSFLYATRFYDERTLSL